MGLRGPLPKDPSRRARNGVAAGDIPNLELVFEPGQQPDLPTTWIDKDGNLEELTWSPLTLNWWEAWCTSPQAKILSKSDWNSLLSTAFVADRFFKTMDVRYASELRQREAHFGATPLDRLRLKMAWLEHEEKDAKRSGQADAPPNNRDRYTGLRPVAGQ